MKFAAVPLRILGWLTLGALWIPVLGLAAGCLTDRGPTGELRVSLFPFALAAWSPFTWICVRNSVAAASIVVALSCAIGNGIAELTGPRRFWGRAPLRATAAIPLAVGPFLGTLGLRLLADRLRLVDLLETRTGSLFVFGTTWENLVSWAVLITGNTLVGAMVVAATMEKALAEIDPKWIEAGRALGATARRARRDLVRPNLRPALAEAAASVFAAFLLEPGGPIAARLPRTLGLQVADAAVRAGDIPRAAALVVIGIAVGLLGRLVARRWGGPRFAPTSEEPTAPTSASWGRTGASLTALAFWSILGLLPLIGFALVLAGEGTVDERLTHFASLVHYGLLDRGVIRIFVVSAALGLGATAVVGFVVSVTAARGGPVSEAATKWLGWTPAVGFGVGGPAAAFLLERWIGFDGLDPLRRPGVLLLLASAAASVSVPARAAIAARRRSRPELIDAALAFGASKRLARRTGRGAATSFGIWTATAAAAATELSPALLLCPSSDVRPIGPAVLDLMEDPRRAAALALAIVAVRLVLRSGRLTSPVH